MLEIVEKRLGMEHWQINGMDRGGRRFPIVFYTQNESRRTADAHERREIYQSGKPAEEDGFILACGEFKPMACVEFQQLVLERLVWESAGGFRCSGVHRSCGRMAK